MGIWLYEFLCINLYVLLIGIFWIRDVFDDFYLFSFEIISILIRSVWVLFFCIALEWREDNLYSSCYRNFIKVYSFNYL